MADLIAILAEARRRGLIGRVGLEIQVEHALAFADLAAPLVEHAAKAGSEHRPLVVDLGSGGGLPSCALIEAFPQARFALIERGERRAEFLRWMVSELGADDRATVVQAEVEAAARDAHFECAATLVTARSFAAPAVTAECACRFLAMGGTLLVSEPPEDNRRWSSRWLGTLGLELGERTAARGFTFQSLERTGEPEARFPRRPGVPRKRPLW
jgi:16S rRNA (guanine527-N7)-methyltransferase